MTAPFRLDRRLIRVTGPDARRFLQDVLTQDLTPLDNVRVRYAALLTAQGKVLADMLVWADGGDVILDTDPTRGDDLMKRLSLYKLRAQAALTDVDNLAVSWSPEQFPGATADPRLPTLGWRRLVRADQASGLADGNGAFDQHRIALGIPDLARDAATDEVFAGEALLDELNGVDFQKGCFVGQENVSRMKRRATTRKKFCPVTFDGAPPAHGTPIRAGDAELGTIRTGINGRAIALLRLDRALEAIAADKPLSAGETPLRLDPPSWLIMPSGPDAPG